MYIIIYNCSQKPLETVPISIIRWRDELFVVSSINGIQYIIKKEYTTDTCIKMDETQKPLWRVSEGKNNNVCTVWFYLYKAVEETTIIYSDGNKISSCLSNKIVFMKLYVICQNMCDQCILPNVFYCKEIIPKVDLESNTGHGWNTFK